EVETAQRREARFRESSRQGLDRLTQIATLVLVAAAIAMAAAMAGVVWLRRPRLAALKLTGFDDGTVWRMLLLESSVVLGVGCSIGAIFGLYGQLMLTRWLRDVTGFPTAYATAGMLALAIFAAVTFVAVLVAAVPGYLAARTPPAASLQAD
ncbi:MAG: FtsX-like permease family protein, partial [Conexibacter sp.]